MCAWNHVSYSFDHVRFPGERTLEIMRFIFRLVSKSFFQQIIGFGIAGGAAFLTDLALFNLLIRISLGPSASGIFAALGALTVNFVINHEAFVSGNTFRHDLRRKTGRFLAVALGSFILLTGIFEIVLAQWPSESALFYTIVRAVIIACGSIFRFVLLKFWVFAGKQD